MPRGRTPYVRAALTAHVNAHSKRCFSRSGKPCFAGSCKLSEAKLMPAFEAAAQAKFDGHRDFYAFGSVFRGRYVGKGKSSL